MPTLWIGTSLGSVQTVVFNTPAHGERHAHPVVVSTCSKQILFIIIFSAFNKIYSLKKHSTSFLFKIAQEHVT